MLWLLNMHSGFQLWAELPEFGEILPCSGSGISTTTHLPLQRPRNGPLQPCCLLDAEPMPTAVPAPGPEGMVTQQGCSGQTPAPCKGADHGRPLRRRFPSPTRKALWCGIGKEGVTKQGTHGRGVLLEHNRVQGNTAGIYFEKEKGSNDTRGPQGLCQQWPRRGWGGPRHRWKWQAL